MYYKCEWCGVVDNDPPVIEDKEVGYSGLTCHRCGSDVHEAERCIECNDYFSTECDDDFFHTARDITGQGVGYCPTCLKALCDVKTGLEYIQHFARMDEFIDFCVEDQEIPFVRIMLRRAIEAATEDDELLAEKLWDYVCDDAGHFADYVYNKSKGGDNE